ncbi:nucleotide-diphosphate-sugar epimerase [Streptomyces inusitatus]|uniref:Nucleotide-diphosphate-sugar epimerase n=1 Tax=Streptomyces inusitatus TaxID=68221 RepID=A0A918QQE7_9ACTN|nr:NAD(P)H-binding protein [Streptomyces inusitatus]GGZ62037.1 nucleotide-diphosphate-sugar epimerase [Streptomyces inusitatus]
MTILVSGATGNIGRHVVRRLAADGREVRALTRAPATAAPPPGVTVAEGDLARPETLRAALAGVSAMLLFPVADAVDEVVALAADAGVRRIVVLSSAAVTAGYDTDYHLPVERAVERSGLEWTHVRPGEFALNSLQLWGPSVREGRRVVDIAPDEPGIPVHEADIADVAVAALTEDRHTGRAYDISGPSAVTPRERVAAIAAAIGEPVRLETVTQEEALAFYRRQGGWAAENAEFIFGFEDYSGTPIEEGEPAYEGLDSVPWLTAAEVTGGVSRDFAEWARDHAADFR